LFIPIAAKEYLNNWKQVAFQCGYVTILESTPTEDGDMDLKLGPPNEEVRMWFKKELIDLLIGTDANSALHRFAASLANFQFNSAKESLQTYLNNSRIKPDNEADLRIFICHCLLTVDKIFEDITNERPVPMEHELTNKGNVPINPTSAAKKIDIAILIDNTPNPLSILALELKFGNKKHEALKQLDDRMYMHRAKKYYTQIRKPTVEIEDKNVFGVGVAVTKLKNGKFVVDFSKCQNLKETGEESKSKAMEKYEKVMAEKERPAVETAKSIVIEPPKQSEQSSIGKEKKKKIWREDELNKLVELKESGITWKTVVEQLNEKFGNNRTRGACQQRYATESSSNKPS
jgi:hypothetical protein